MKTQILQLEVHDDVISILDKIGWTQTERVLIVLPRRRRILTHKLDLLRLKRHSQKRGCQIAFVTSDPLVKALAQEVNLPVFHSIQKAYQAEWPKESAMQFPPAMPSGDKKPLEAQMATLQAIRSKNTTYLLPLWTRLGWFTLAVLAVMSILGVLAPSATIRFTPPVQQQTITIPIIATHRAQQARISGEVPISTLRVTVSGRKTIKASGAITLPKDFATGEVTLTNLTDQTIEVPAGTVLRTLDQKPRRYATQQTVLLKTDNEKTTTVTVQALEAGSAHNAQPNEIKAVEGLLGLKIAVNNPSPVQGGSDMTASAPSEQDRRLLFQQLQAELIEEAKDRIPNELQKGDLLLPESTIKTVVLRQQYIPEKASPSDSLSLDLEIEVSFGVVTRQSLLDLGDQILASSLPAGYQPLRDTFTATCQNPFIQTENGDYTCNLELFREVQLRFNPEEIRQLVVGKSISNASRLLQQTYRLSEPPNIAILPRWFPILPLLPMRIEVVTKK
mgnify:CR=1 FL=1